MHTFLHSLVEHAGSISIIFCMMKQGLVSHDIKIRNRRFAKMKQLKQTGFFDEQEVMMRHPHLYHHYVGKYKCMKPRNYGNMSQFFQAQALNSEYRRMISSEQLCSVHDQESEEQEVAPQQLQEVTELELELQEQALIDELENLFLEGKQQSINYQQIDQNSQLDYSQGNCKEMDNDEEERYFDTNSDPPEVHDPDNNTGIQDF